MFFRWSFLRQCNISLCKKAKDIILVSGINDSDRKVLVILCLGRTYRMFLLYFVLEEPKESSCYILFWKNLKKVLKNNEEVGLSEKERKQYFEGSQENF